MSWSITVPEPSTSHEQPPPGTHAAVCVAVIDLGLHEVSFQQRTYVARQLLLAWELTACRMSGSTANHVVARQYSASLAEKAGLRRLLKGWFGRDIAPGQEFDPRKLLGRKCLLNLVLAKDGKHVQIDGASQLPAGMPCNPATHAPFAPRGRRGHPGPRLGPLAVRRARGRRDRPPAGGPGARRPAAAGAAPHADAAAGRARGVPPGPARQHGHHRRDAVLGGAMSAVVHANGTASANGKGWTTRVPAAGGLWCPEEARQALTALADPAAGVELMRLPGGQRVCLPGSDVAGLVRQAERWADGAAGLYYSLGTVDPALARPARVGDVLRRRWLLVDLDPRRPRDVSATDAEHESARLLALQVLDGLAGLGWPDPLLVDSGNGFHLLYRLDLANDETTRPLVMRVLRAVKGLYETDAVEIDDKVGNANRHGKLPGCWARKGPDTADRPHRPCRMIHLPGRVEVVGRDLLEELAGPEPKRSDPAAFRLHVPPGNRYGAVALDREVGRLLLAEQRQQRAQRRRVLAVPAGGRGRAHRGRGHRPADRRRPVGRPARARDRRDPGQCAGQGPDAAGAASRTGRRRRGRRRTARRRPHGRTRPARPPPGPAGGWT